MEENPPDPSAKKKRTSSILKSTPRKPFSELEFHIATPTDSVKNRRVSFSSRTGVAEFATTEATTTWMKFYEERNKSLESSGPDGINYPRSSVGHVGNRIFEQQFQDIEAELDFGGNIEVAGTDIENSLKFNYTEQLDKIKGIHNDTKPTVPNNNFDVSYATENVTSKVFKDSLTYTAMPEMSDRINIDFSAVQNIGETEKDLALLRNCVVGPSFGNDSQIFEVELNNSQFSHIERPSLNKDWVEDKENIDLNPYIMPAGTDNFAFNDGAEKVLVFDGKKLKYANVNADLDEQVDRTIKSDKSNLYMIKSLPEEMQRRQTIVFEKDDADISMTQAISNPMVKNDKTMFEQQDDLADMSITQTVQSSINEKKKAKFEESLLDYMSVSKNALLLGNTEKGTLNSAKTQTISFDALVDSSLAQRTIYQNRALEENNQLLSKDDILDMSISQAIPCTNLSTINQEKHISMTEADSVTSDTNILIERSKADAEDEQKKKSLSLYQDTDISITQIAANYSVEDITKFEKTNVMKKDEGKNKRHTIVFNNNSGDISITQVIPSQILLDNQILNENDISRRTILLNDSMDNTSMIKAIPAIVITDENKDLDLCNSQTQLIKKNNRKTIIFEGDDAGEISMTQVIPAQFEPNSEPITEDENFENTLHNTTRGTKTENNNTTDLLDMMSKILNETVQYEGQEPIEIITNVDKTDDEEGVNQTQVKNVSKRLSVATKACNMDVSNRAADYSNYTAPQKMLCINNEEKEEIVSQNITKERFKDDVNNVTSKTKPDKNDIVFALTKSFSDLNETANNKSKVIPTYAVDDGIKELMSDLVKPMADIFPLCEYKRNIEEKPSTCSTQIQTNLMSSSQIDVEVELISKSESITNFDQLKCKSLFERLNQFESESTSEPTQEDRKTAKVLNKSVKDTETQKQPMRELPYSNRIVAFDHTNPLNNVLIAPVNFSDAHEYNPKRRIESKQSSNVRLIKRIKLDHSSKKQLENLAVKQKAGNSIKRKNVASNVSFPSKASTNCNTSKKIEAKDAEVVIAMKNNKEILDVNSSLTLIDDKTSSTLVESSEESIRMNLDKSESSKARKRSFKNLNPGKHELLDVTPRPSTKLEKRSISPQSPSEVRIKLEDVSNKATPFKMDYLQVPSRSKTRKTNSTKTSSAKKTPVKTPCTNVTAQQVTTHYGAGTELVQNLASNWSPQNHMHGGTSPVKIVITNHEVSESAEDNKNTSNIAIGPVNNGTKNTSNNVTVQQVTTHFGAGTELVQNLDSTKTSSAKKTPIKSPRNSVNVQQVKKDYGAGTKLVQNLASTNTSSAKKTPVKSPRNNVTVLQVTTHFGAGKELVLNPASNWSPQNHMHGGTSPVRIVITNHEVSESAEDNKNTSNNVTVQQVTTKLEDVSNKATPIKMDYLQVPSRSKTRKRNSTKTSSAKKTPVKTPCTNVTAQQVTTHYGAGTELVQNLASNWSPQNDMHGGTSPVRIVITNHEVSESAEDNAIEPIKMGTTRNHLDSKRIGDLLDKVNELPLLGTLDCKWMSRSLTEWSFLLMSSRISITFHMSEDLVDNITLHVLKPGKKSTVGALAVEVTYKALSLMLKQGTLEAKPTRDLYLLLLRCGLVTHVADDWAMGMCDTQQRIAYQLTDNHDLILKVVNVPSRTVWDVHCSISIARRKGALWPWPRLDVNQVSMVAGDCPCPLNTVTAILDGLHRCWSHVPAGLWAINDYLQNYQPC